MTVCCSKTARHRRHGYLQRPPSLNGTLPKTLPQEPRTLASLPHRAEVNDLDRSLTCPITECVEEPVCPLM